MPVVFLARFRRINQKVQQVLASTKANFITLLNEVFDSKNFLVIFVLLFHKHVFGCRIASDANEKSFGVSAIDLYARFFYLFAVKRR